MIHIFCVQTYLLTSMGAVAGEDMNGHGDAWVIVNKW